MMHLGMKSVSAKTHNVRCGEAKELLSPFLDGAVTGTEMQALQEHLDRCAACMREYRLLRQTQQLLMNMGRPKAAGRLGIETAFGDFAGGRGDPASAHLKACGCGWRMR